MDNDGGTSDLIAPVFDMESERSESDTNTTETRSSCVDDCCLDDVFSSTGSDESEDEFPELHQNDQRFYTTEFIYNTMICVIDAKGIVKSCIPNIQHLPIYCKNQCLERDIAAIENYLRSFSGHNFDYCDVYTREQILGQIDFVMKNISGLDDYWNGHYLVTEELNRQINELKHSNTVLCHMNQEVADLYSIYVDTKFRLQCMLIYHKNELVSFEKSQKFLKKFLMRSPSDGPVSSTVTSDSESVTSDSISEFFSSEFSRSEFSIDDDKSDGSESLFNTDSVDEDVETHHLNNNARLRREKPIADKCRYIFSFVMILWVSYLIIFKF